MLCNSDLSQASDRHIGELGKEIIGVVPYEFFSVPNMDVLVLSFRVRVGALQVKLATAVELFSSLSTLQTMECEGLKSTDSEDSFQDFERVLGDSVGCDENRTQREIEWKNNTDFV